MFGLFEDMNQYNAANQFAKEFFALDVMYARVDPVADVNGKYVMYLRDELLGVMNCEIVDTVELPQEVEDELN